MAGWAGRETVGGRAGIGAAASYCQMHRKRSFGEAKSAAAPIPALLTKLAGVKTKVQTQSGGFFAKILRMGDT